jgi:hypothetical protein
MLRHSRLGDSQGPDHVSDRPFLLPQELEDATTVVIGQHLECVHFRQSSALVI